jgi:hypothetical protein
MGHPFCFGCPKETGTTADPYGMTTRKTTAKARATADPLWGLTARKAKANEKAKATATATATAKATAGPSTSLRMTGFGDGDRYGTATGNSRFLRCAAHDKTVSSFGRNDDLFGVGASRGAELGARILVLRPG